MKKILSLVLALFMVCSLFNGVTVSATTIVDLGKCGENVTWILDSDGLLTISGNGEIVRSSPLPWDDYRDSIKSVDIKEGVTGICSYAFSGCSSLASVLIGDDVTNIGSNAFYDCPLLTDVIIGNGVINIESSAFCNCDSLQSITIPNSVTAIGMSAFKNCSSLANVTIGNNVTSIGYEAFSYCSKLTSIVIPDKVTSIGDKAFYDCNNLTDVIIGENVTSIGNSAFESCGSLTAVEIFENVKEIGSKAFYGCSDLIYVFYHGSSEQWAEIIDTQDLYNYYISNAKIYFNFNSTMNDAIISSGNCGTNLSWSVNYSGLLIISGSGEMDDYVWDEYECYAPWDDSIKSVVIKDGVTSIGKAAFNNCDLLKSITIPDSVTSIGEHAFDGCSSLSSIEIPNSVTSIGEHAFDGCSSLSSIEIPNSVTSIGDYAFHWCTSLASVDLGNGVKSIGKCAFHGCDSLQSITIPDSVTVMGQYAFWSCNSLESVKIGNGVTNIPSHAFYDCGELTEVSIGSNVINIAPSAFESSELNSIIIPDSVAFIGDKAFYSCPLSEVTIGSGVIGIGAEVFSGTIDVYYNGTVADWMEIEIDTNNSALSKANIYFNSSGESSEPSEESSEPSEEPSEPSEEPSKPSEEPTESALTFSKERVAPGKKIKMLFTMPKTLVSSSLSLNIEFDNEAFEIVEIANAPYADMQPNMAGCNNNGNVAISWVDPTFDANTEITEGTKLLEVTFKVKETAELGTRSFDIVDYTVTGLFDDETYMPEDITPDAGALTRSVEIVEMPTYTVSGTVKAFGGTSEDVTIELLSGGEVVDTKTVTGKTGTYTFEDVEEGTYTVRVSKTMHAVREYTVEVYDDITSNAEIWLYGDVTADGIVNSVDILQINRNIANLSSVFNQTANADYRFKVANITNVTSGDNIINASDTLQINRKVANLSSIFDKIA